MSGVHSSSGLETSAFVEGHGGRGRGQGSGRGGRGPRGRPQFSYCKQMGDTQDKSYQLIRFPEKSANAIYSH